MEARHLRVLIVEDHAPVAEALQLLCSLHDLPCAVTGGPDEALAAVRAGGVGVVVQDMNFAPGETSGAEGAALFREIRALDPSMPVLLMTAFTSLERAVELVREGAADYFAKPWNDRRLLESIQALLTARRDDEARRTSAGTVPADARDALSARHDLRGLVYASGRMHRVVSLALQVAGADVPVLITGPNGVGKEKIAEIIQANSPRARQPFVTVNAGALPDTLLEAELFGAEAGAYTGAQRRRIGRFEAAHRGTLFLDEIGNLPVDGQARLLRVLQSGTFERLGSNDPVTVDVRVICATNADLQEAIAAGRFREDLYFRLNVIEIDVPALADRRADILPIARALLAHDAAPSAPPRLSREAESALLGHDWPGNVRELQNRLQRARLLAHGAELTPEDLGLAGHVAAAGHDDEGREALEALLHQHRGSVSRVAEALGLSRQALYRRMDRYGIVIERRPRGQ
jgi:DNA-binding NtrC family response regulator